MENGIVIGPSRGGMDARVAEVARATGWRAVQRRGSLASLLARHDAGLAYIAARDGDRVTDGTQKLAVERGLLHAKRADGAEHPLMRAIGPAGRVLDGTLGLAGDALHLATRYDVVGSEVSPVVGCLVRDGLQRLDVAEARRIRVEQGTSRQVYERCGPFDVVFLAPMFGKPAAAAPGYAIFRRIADHRPLDVTFWEACDVRVVVRVEKGEPSPLSGAERLQGKAVDYWIRPATDRAAITRPKAG